jgi:branched-chain amino acid transport system ATP-binding protein
MAEAALQLDGVTSGYGEAMVLRDVNLTLAPGEVLTVLGKNGMGKSTLLKTIMGFLPPRDGRVHIHGRDVTRLAPHRRAAQSVAYSPQDQAIFQDLTVGENLRLGLQSDRAAAAAMDRVTAFFPFLAQRGRQPAGTLSGGEQKMLIMARALLSNPRLLLIDEISEGLQPSVILRLAEVLRRECATRELTILIIEQNLRFALSVASRYAVLVRGEIVDAGIVAPGAEAKIQNHLAV